MAHKRDYKPEDIAFPNQVTVKSAEVNSSCRNTIKDLTVTTADGISTLEYDVTNYTVSSNKSNDLIDLILDVMEKPEGTDDTYEEKGSTACTSVENNQQALVQQNVSITVSEPYFPVRLYGPQDAWMDMSRGDGRASSSSRLLRFYGADDPSAVTMHKWTFDEEPISKEYLVNADGAVMVGPTVNNLYTNMQWKLVGFVPISYWSGEIRDRWDPLYGVYYLEDLDACRQLITDCNGVLYGETPTEEQAEALAQYRDGSGAAKVICVWYIQEPPKEVYTKYEYTDAYVPKVHPAAYTKTSSGIDVQIDTALTGSGIHAYNVTFTIPADYNADTITLNTELNDAVKPVLTGFQPGDKIQYNIKVIDNSGKYGYLKDSGAVGTIDYYTNGGFNYSVIGNGFEGYKIENADTVRYPGSPAEAITTQYGSWRQSAA